MALFKFASDILITFNKGDNMSVIYVTVKLKNSILLQNKTALRINTEKEDINEVAKDFRNEVAKEIKISESNLVYETFVKNNGNFYKLTKE